MPAFAGRLAALGLLTAVFAAGPATAQSPWLSEEPGTVALEVLHLSRNSTPRPTTLPELNTWTNVYFLTGRFAVSEGTDVLIELPFAHAGVQGMSFIAPGFVSTGTFPSNVLGNPFLGIEYRPVGRPGSFLFGARLPLDRDFNGNHEARVVGMITAFDRFEAFSQLKIGILAIGAYSARLSPRFALKLRGGAALDAQDTGSGSSGELYAAYSGQGWYESGPGRFAAGLSGRMIVSEPGLTLGERTIHQLGVWTDYRIGRFRPGLHLRWPLDRDLSEMDRLVVGVSLSVQLSR